ncbi:hypothetical protein L9F63_007488, partial [Diploptera punctata]
SHCVKYLLRVRGNYENNRIKMHPNYCRFMNEIPQEEGKEKAKTNMGIRCSQYNGRK